MQHIIEILEQYIQPALTSHGGGVHFLGMKNGVVYIQLLGQCANCPSSYLTVEQLILAQLRKEYPSLTQICVVNPVKDELLLQARKLLNKHPG